MRSTAIRRTRCSSARFFSTMISCDCSSMRELRRAVCVFSRSGMFRSLASFSLISETACNGQRSYFQAQNNVPASFRQTSPCPTIPGRCRSCYHCPSLKERNQRSREERLQKQQRLSVFEQLVQRVRRKKSRPVSVKMAVSNTGNWQLL